MGYVKKYDVGSAKVDLPTSNYLYELPLLSLADTHGGLDLLLIFNYKLFTEGNNEFNVRPGYKLNVQKRIIKTNNVPTEMQEESGKVVTLTGTDTLYVLDDGSQRILRRTGAKHELENPDFSKECYDENGRIISAIDKYGATVLSYTYNVNGQLSSITYRGEKTVNFTYSGNNLYSITYDGKVTTLSYTGTGINVLHYSGAAYSMVLSGMNFTVTSVSSENNSENTYVTQITKKSDYELTITKLANNFITDYVGYKFPGDISDCDTEYSQVEVENYHGKKARIHFRDDKALYSYEIGDTDAEFVNGKYAGVVNVHSIFNNKRGFYKSYAQGMNDGTPLELADASTDVSCVINGGTEETEGIHILSGWIKLADANYTKESVELYIGRRIDSPTYTFKLPKSPVGQWAYFSVGFPYGEDTLCAYIYKLGASIETKDFRLSFQPKEVATEDSSVNIPLSEDVLILKNSNTPVYFPISDSIFSCENLEITETEEKRIVYFEDILKYKINQWKSRNLTEFYVNKVKKILVVSTSSNVKFTYNGSEYLLNDCYLGRRKYTENGIITTRLTDGDSSKGILCTVETLDDNDNIITSYTIDGCFDVTKSQTNGVTTLYTREDGLITEEKVDGLYTRTTSYAKDDSGNYLVTKTDEFGNQTIYAIDGTWGATTSVTLPDGTSISNVYDDDKSTLLTQNFGTNNNYLSNVFGYRDGCVGSLSTGALNYTFSCDKGELSQVFKCGSSVEEHIVASGKKTVANHYPSYNDSIYSFLQKVDDYDRLGIVTDVLKNSYDLQPTFSDGEYTTVGINSGSAKLASTEDYILGNKIKYAYDNGRLTQIGTFDSSETKTNEEYFTYDQSERVKKDLFKYDGMGNFVQSDITFVTEEGTADADNRVSTYSYKVNDVERAKTQNTFDTYKRLSKKRVTVGGSTYGKDFVYDKTRLSGVKDLKNGTIIHNASYGYDAIGRIVSQVDSADSTTNNTYAYDTFGRVVRENNKALDKTYVYEYNEIGNVTSVKAYPYTTSDAISGNATVTPFTYGDSNNPDRLTKFGGKDLTYDLNGCPVRYGDKVLVWDKGKLIKVYDYIDENSSASSETVEFKYNAYGQRVYKHYEYNPGPDYSGDFMIDFTTTYTYDAAGRLISERRAEGYTESASKTYVTTYLYDQSTVIGFTITSDGVDGTYYYHRNLLGDVEEVYDASGNRVVKYAYDAWGNVATKQGQYSTPWQYNNITYRGYYYDKETGMYCCGYRYYVSKLRRFISPDSTEYLDSTSVDGLNLYAYCCNDPVNYCDPSGHIAISTLIIGAIIGFIVGGATSAISQGLTNGWDNINGWQVLLDGTIGGISGALGASGINQIVSMIVGGVLGAAGSVGGDLIASGGNWSQVNVGKAVLMGAIGVGLGRWTGAGTQNSKAMASTINAGKSWGSKVFLTSAKEALLRPNSGLTLQNMYMNMSKAIGLYTVQGITKVSVATLGSTILGNTIGW